jgi:hypothetical protein
MQGQQTVRVLAAFSACALAGCNLFPPLVRGIDALEGKVADGRYTSPDGTLSLRVPQTDSYELRWMQAKEIAKPDEFYVSFGPAAFDQSIYRCGVTRLGTGLGTDVDLRDACHRIVEQTGLQLEPMTHTALETVDERADTIQGQAAYGMHLRQHAPAGTVSNRDTSILHEAWLVRYGDRLTFTWVQTYEGQPTKGIGAQEFTRSVELR